MKKSKRLKSKKNKKFGFVLESKKRLTGALLQNREVFLFLKKQGLDIGEILPKTHYYYQNLPTIGSLFNYFTVYENRKKFKYCIATSIAGTPFLEKDVKLISLFHCLDSGSINRVRETLKNEAMADQKNRKYWLSKIKKMIISAPCDLNVREKTRYIIETACLAKAEAAICVSPLVKKEIEKNFKNLPRKGIKTILNGVPDYFFKSRKLNPLINKNKLNIIFTSRISRQEYSIYEKGIDRILGIYSKNYRNANKIFIAHFTKCEKIKKFWKNLLTSKNVKVVGNIPRKKIPSYLKKGDIFIQTSRTEACQLVLLESMASGLIPVSYPVGVAPLFIKNNKNGYIVHSITEAADKINYLIKRPDLRKKMSDECIKIANKNFKYQRMMDEYYNFFKRFK